MLVTFSCTINSQLYNEKHKIILEQILLKVTKNRAYSLDYMCFLHFTLLLIYVDDSV